MVNIRPAQPEDAATLVDLNHRIFVNNINYDDDLKEDPAPVSYFEELVQREDGCFLILEEDGKPIGYINGMPVRYFSYRKSRYFEVENLGVLPDKKGQGFGRMLLEAITKWAKEQNYQKIYIHSYGKNTEAIEFYKRNGYSIIDVSLEKVI